MNKPVVTDIAEREQPEHLREYFREWTSVLRLNSQKQPHANVSLYKKPEEGE